MRILHHQNRSHCCAHSVSVSFFYTHLFVIRGFDIIPFDFVEAHNMLYICMLFIIFAVHSTICQTFQHSGRANRSDPNKAKQ